MMIPAFLARLIILSLGYLYPAFNSYKAIRDKNTREYVKWMMYWVVFALFCFVENFADIFIAFWCPLYQELKILTVIWFLAPATRGSSYLYRNFVHPFFSEKAAEIDGYLGRIHKQGIVLIVGLSTRLFASISASLFEAFLKFAPQLAFGAAQFPMDQNNRSAPTTTRSVLTTASASHVRPNQLALETEGHGDEGDGASIGGRIVELSDVDENEAAPVVPKAKRRQPQVRKRPTAVSHENVAKSQPKHATRGRKESEPLISEDESEDEVMPDDIHLQDEDIVELARSESINSFEREFFPREMLPSPSEEDLATRYGKDAAASRDAKKRVPAARSPSFKSNLGQAVTRRQAVASAAVKKTRRP